LDTQHTVNVVFGGVPPKDNAIAQVRLKKGIIHDKLDFGIEYTSTTQVQSPNFFLLKWRINFH
jgi:hypothetical protein